MDFKKHPSCLHSAAAALSQDHARRRGASWAKPRVMVTHRMKGRLKSCTLIRAYFPRSKRSSPGGLIGGNKLAQRGQNAHLV